MRISDWSSDVCSSDLGVPAAQIGSVGGPIAGQINNFIGGNPALVPEKSTTWTIGAVIQPRALPGFTATVAFFDLQVKDAILQIPGQSVLDIGRSEERRVGNECVSPCYSTWSPHD